MTDGNTTIRTHGCCRHAGAEPLLLRGFRASELRLLPLDHGDGDDDRVRLSCRVRDVLGDGAAGFVCLTVHVNELRAVLAGLDKREAELARPIPPNLGGPMATMTRGHSALAQFAFPASLGREVDALCQDTGVTRLAGQGLWSQECGTGPERVEMGLVSARSAGDLEPLRLGLADLLTEYGEAEMWFVITPVIEGGVYTLQERRQEARTGEVRGFGGHTDEREAAA